MEIFNYIVSFQKLEQKYQLLIELQYENYIISVFKRTFKDDLEDFNRIYHQIVEYFNHTTINMTKNDLIMFYNTFKAYDLIIPNPKEIILLEEVTLHDHSITPKEMLFLSYIHGKATDYKIAKYWVDEYDLDLDYTIHQLLTLNYLTTKIITLILTKLKNENCKRH